MRFDVITLFPDMFATVRDWGVSARAHQQGIWSLATWNPRDFTHDVHRTVDARPYGGGPGMVMLAEPLEQAVQAARQARAAQSPVSTDVRSVNANAARPRVILMSPAGRRFDQRAAETLVQSNGAILVCGRYEGVDQRFIDHCVTDEISLGDFVLSGGEIAALAIIDSVVRLLPGVLNDDQSAAQDSFHAQLAGLLDSPHYTRPQTHANMDVPPELRSGDHARIAQWRRQQSLRLTWQRRPDLIAQARSQRLLTASDEAFLLSLQAHCEHPIPRAESDRAPAIQTAL